MARSAFPSLAYAGISRDLARMDGWLVIIIPSKKMKNQLSALAGNLIISKYFPGFYPSCNGSAKKIARLQHIETGQAGMETVQILD